MTNLLLRQELLEQELNCVTGGISKKTKKGLIIGSSAVGGVILLSLIVFGIVMGVRRHAKKKNTGKSISPQSQDTTTTSGYVPFGQIQIPKIKSPKNLQRYIDNDGLFIDMSSNLFTIDAIAQDGQYTKIKARILQYMTVHGANIVDIEGEYVNVSQNGRFFVRIKGTCQYKEINTQDIQHIQQAEHVSPKKECWISEFQASTHKRGLDKILAGGIDGI